MLIRLTCTAVTMARQSLSASQRQSESQASQEGQRPVRITHEARLKNEGCRVEVHAEAVLPAK